MDDAVIEHADAVEWLGRQPAGAATAVILDWPYGIGTTPVRGKEDGAAGTTYRPYRLMRETLGLSGRALRPGGIAVIFSDWRRMGDMGDLVTMTGLRLSACVAWVRTRPGSGGLFRSSWDPVLIASRGTPDAVSRAAVRNVVETADAPGLEFDDVVVANYPSRRRHPYEKPWEVTHHILQRVGPPGLVLDPFSGSGSTRIACEKLGLEFRGADIDPQWADAEVTPS